MFDTESVMGFLLVATNRKSAAKIFFVAKVNVIRNDRVINLDIKALSR